MGGRTQENPIALIVLLLAIILVVMCSGCVYHSETTKENGEHEVLHVGFPQFSDDKEINIIKVN